MPARACRYGFWAASYGVGALVPPGDAIFPRLTIEGCEFGEFGNDRHRANATYFLECRRKIPLLSQPGKASLYAFDYDVLGLALGRAYNMTPDELMRVKIWEPVEER